MQALNLIYRRDAFKIKVTGKGKCEYKGYCPWSTKAGPDNQSSWVVFRVDKTSLRSPRFDYIKYARKVLNAFGETQY